MEIFTEQEALALLAAMKVLDAKEGHLRHASRGPDATQVYQLGGAEVICNVAKDSLFSVLNQASAYLGCEVSNRTLADWITRK